jgi:hypothetical protein
MYNSTVWAGVKSFLAMIAFSTRISSISREAFAWQIALSLVLWLEFSFNSSCAKVSWLQR